MVMQMCLSVMLYIHCVSYVCSHSDMDSVFWELGDGGIDMFLVIV